MKAISLWQPWAQAIPMGLKHYETRSWATSYRGPLAIHAAKVFTAEQRIVASEWAALYNYPARVPLGAVVAVVELVDVIRTEDVDVTARERIFGDYTPGRFAWKLDKIFGLAIPVFCNGRQGFFDVPDELLEEQMRHAVQEFQAAGQAGACGSCGGDLDR